MSIDKVNKLMGFIDGMYLDSSTLPNEGVVVTIKSIKTESILNPRTFKEAECKVMYFEEIKWGMVLGAKINRKTLVGMVKDSSAELIGKKIVIYKDPNVKFGRETVGAVRIKRTAEETI